MFDSCFDRKKAIRSGRDNAPRTGNNAGNRTDDSAGNRTGGKTGNREGQPRKRIVLSRFSVSQFRSHNLCLGSTFPPTTPFTILLKQKWNKLGAKTLF